MTASSEVADTGAQEPTVQPDAKETDPFAGFVQEEYERGELVTPVPKDEKPAEEAPQNEEKPADEEKPEGDGKPRKTFQERIDELTRARRDAERERDELKRQLEAKAEPPAAKPETKGGDSKSTSDEKPAEGEKAAPKPEDFAFGELDPEYIAALVDYKAEQRFAKYEAERQAAAEQAEAERKAREEYSEFQQRFQKRAAEGTEKYPDFQEKVIEGAQRGEWELSQELANLIVDSDVGADIVYHLASNPEEAARVARQSPLEQARFFGRMESKFSAEREAAPSASAGSPAPAKTPQAPPPVPSARGASGRFEAPADTSDFAAFERRVMGEL